MPKVALLVVLLALQLRAPSTLRDPATPPAEGTGKFREYTYTYRQESINYILEYTPHLPNKRAIVLDAMLAACQDLFDLNFSRVKPHPGPAPNEWVFQLQDLRSCYAKQMPSPTPGGDVKSIQVSMP